MINGGLSTYTCKAIITDGFKPQNKTLTTMTCGGGSFASEVGWSLTDDASATVTSFYSGKFKNKTTKNEFLNYLK